MRDKVWTPAARTLIQPVVYKDLNKIMIDYEKTTSYSLVDAVPSGKTITLDGAITLGNSPLLVTGTNIAPETYVLSATPSDKDTVVILTNAIAGPLVAGASITVLEMISPVKLPNSTKFAISNLIANSPTDFIVDLAVTKGFYTPGKLMSPPISINQTDANNIAKGLTAVGDFTYTVEGFSNSGNLSTVTLAFSVSEDSEYVLPDTVPEPDLEPSKQAYTIAGDGIFINGDAFETAMDIIGPKSLGYANV